MWIPRVTSRPSCLSQPHNVPEQALEKAAGGYTVTQFKTVRAAIMTTVPEAQIHARNPS